MKKVLLITVAVLLVAGVFVYYQSHETVAVEETTTEQSIEQTAPEGAMMEAAPAEIKEIVINNKGMSFEQKEIVVNQGDTVRVTFRNTGGTHDFVIDEFNVKTTQLQAGSEETVEFVADKPGTFEYYCSVGNHRAMGMKGTLIVN